MELFAAAPNKDPVLGQSELIGFKWLQWLNALRDRLNLASKRLITVSLTTQAASIGATAFGFGAQPAGLFRVSWYARITQAATTSSSLTVTVGNTDAAINCTQSGAAITGNTTATVQGSAVFVRADRSNAPTYATTYSSVGGTPMQYRLDLTCEAVS